MKNYSYKEYEFEVVDYNEKFDVYFLDNLRKLEENEMFEYFMMRQEELLNEILDKDFNVDGKYSIMFVPEGDLFSYFADCPYKSGIANRKLDDNCFFVVSDSIIKNITEKRNNIPPSNRKMLIHEWSHMVIYKYNNSLTHTLNEGLADLIPLYILDYQNKMPEYVKKLKSLNINDVVSIEYIDEYDVLDDDLSTPAQNKYTYLSCYLFVLNIIKNIEAKYNKSKLDALIFFLELMRKHEKYHYEVIAEIIDLPLEKLKFNQFQIDALEHI